MNQIEIKFKNLKSYEIQNNVGELPLVTIKVIDLDGSIAKALSTHYSVLSMSAMKNSPTGKAKSFKEMFE